MTHVVVKPVRPPKDGETACGYDVIIDGTPVACMAEGFSITFPDNTQVPVVTMSFWADTLDADLPTAVIKALRVPAEAS